MERRRCLGARTRRVHWCKNKQDAILRFFFQGWLRARRGHAVHPKILGCASNARQPKSAQCAALLLRNGEIPRADSAPLIISCVYTERCVSATEHATFHLLCTAVLDALSLSVSLCLSTATARAQAPEVNKRSARATAAMAIELPGSTVRRVFSCHLHSLAGHILASDQLASKAFGPRR